MDGEDRRVLPHQGELVRKVKAIAQMVSIPLLLWYDPLGPINIGEIGSWLIWIAVILTLYSLVIYTKAAIPFLYPDEKLKNQDR